MPRPRVGNSRPRPPPSDSSSERPSASRRKVRGPVAVQQAGALLPRQHQRRPPSRRWYPYFRPCRRPASQKCRQLARVEQQTPGRLHQCVLQPREPLQHFLRERWPYPRAMGRDAGAAAPERASADEEEARQGCT
eukprot:scaffold102022_cov30-Tisochrysis_lutea.AAC.2